MDDFSQNNDILNIFDAMVSVGEGRRSYLMFELNQEHYGVEFLRVKEIRAWTPVTRVPNTPRHLCGVMNMRGEIVPIVDLRLFLDMPFQPYGKTSVVVLLKVEGVSRRIVGIVVDTVSGAHNIQPEAIREAPDLGDKVDTSFITGITRIDDDMVMLLDIDTLLRSEQIG